MIEHPLECVRLIQEWVTERFSEEGGPAYISPSSLSALNFLSDITYPKTDSDRVFEIDWLMEETGSDNLVGKLYRIERSRKYGLLRKGYELALIVWSSFRLSRLYDNIMAWAVNYTNSQHANVWRSQSWKDAHDLMVYRLKARSSENMERYIPQAIVFKYFKQAFRNIGIPFFVAGRWNPHWWPPDFFEWSQYKFDNILRSMADLGRISDLMEAGTILPEGFTVEELEDLRRRLRELVLRAAGTALNGPADVNESAS